MLQAQRTITGTVVSSEDNQGLPGVQVVAKGMPAVGITTDISGRYSLNVPSEVTHLVFTFMGMATQEIEIGGQTSIDVVMESGAQSIEGVVITGYGNIKKSTYTGSAEVVNSDVIERVQSSNVTKALEGVAPGVQTFNNSGQPGASMDIRIRGIGSIYASNAPLYVVDGAPFSGDINQINPDDVESISLLKDATSAALYGARGANGVVLITTKRGRSGEAQLNFKATYGVTTRGIPEYDVLDAAGYYEALFTGFMNKHIADGKTEAEARAMAAGVGDGSVLQYVGMYNAFKVANNQLIDPLTGKVNRGEGLKYNDSWEDELLQPAARQEYLISATKGDEKNSYFASLGYLDETGMLQNTGFNRLSARLNTSNQIKEWVKLEMGISASHQATNSNASDATNAGNNPFSYVRGIPKIYPVYQYYMEDIYDGENLIHRAGDPVYGDDGNKMYDFGAPGSTFNGMPGGSPGTLGRPYSPSDNNIALLQYDKYSSQVEALNGRFATDFKIIDGLVFRLQGAADIRNNYRMRWMNRLYGNAVTIGGRLSREQMKTFSHTVTEMLTYTKTFAKKHNLVAMAGHEAYKYNYQYLTGEKTGFPFETDELGLGAELTNINSYHYDYTLEGYFTNLNYDYDGKYHGSFSYRRDGTSKFYEDVRWGNFWSIGAAWLLSREDFMKSYNFIDFLKFRVSYGAQGNDAVVESGVLVYYPWQGLYDMTYKNGALPGAMHSSLDNYGLTWESQKMFNVGLDFRFIKKLSGSLEFYTKRNSDMLFRKPLPASSGITSMWQNIGEMKSYGLEFQANYDIINNKDVTWSVGINATHWNNKMTKMAASDTLGIRSGDAQIREGHSPYEFFMVEYAGVDAHGRALYYKASKTRGLEGLDKDNVTTDFASASYYFQGKSSIPKVYGGISTSVGYKGFDLSILCSYSLGGWMVDGYYAGLMGMASAGSGNMHKDILNSWTPTNNNQSIPELNPNYAGKNNGWSTRWLVNGSYINLKNITLGYTVPQELSKKIKIENVRAFVSLDNFWLKSTRKGMDPQRAMAGSTGEAQYYPTKTISFGIQAQF
jgi:TonB-linked SusC/RagA family outer membrane protein